MKRAIVIGTIAMILLFSSMINAKINEKEGNGNNNPEGPYFVIQDPVLKARVLDPETLDIDVNSMEKLFAEKGYDKFIKESSEKWGVEAALIKAIITQESRGDKHAVSSTGAQGLMQLMPETAAELGVADAFDEQQNIDGGTRYIKQQIDTFSRLDYAIAAYNTGPENVRKYDGVPPFAETQNYVVKVLRYYLEYGGKGSFSSTMRDTGGDFKYTVSSAIRTGLNIDFSVFEKANELAQKRKQQIIDCLKIGSGAAGDEDVSKCASAASSGDLKISGEARDKEFLLIFQKAITFHPKFIEKRNQRIKFGYLIKDDIPPPKTKIVKVVSSGSLSPVWEENFASDVEKLELHCSSDNGNTWILVNPGANPKLTNLNNVQACGNSDSYCFKIIAIDKAGNRGEESILCE